MLPIIIILIGVQFLIFFIINVENIDVFAA